MKRGSFHPETRLFPPHNIVGTPGRELYGGVKTTYEKYKDRLICIGLTKSAIPHFTVLPWMLCFAAEESIP